MEVARSIASLLVIGAVACSSSVAPRAVVTLLVTNETCASGTCDSLDVFAFPGVQPNTPGGLWHLNLGVITAPQTCLTLPASAKFLVIGDNGDGSSDTTTFSWSNAHGIRLGTWPPNTPSFQALPSTEMFVPAANAGWSISLPSGKVAISAKPCSTGRTTL
jgi:hypothetical protein